MSRRKPVVLLASGQRVRVADALAAVFCDEMQELGWRVELADPFACHFGSRPIGQGAAQWVGMGRRVIFEPRYEDLGTLE
jgi:hypothetical protein